MGYLASSKMHFYLWNKKVLLRERKRHTACHVASTRCAALSNPDLVWGGTQSQVLGEGYPIPGQGEGIPCPRSGGDSGYPPHLDLGWGTPPTWTWDGVPPHLDLGWGTPLPGPGMGYSPCLDLRWGTPLPRPEMGYPSTQTWDGVPPPTSVDRLKI